MTRLAVIGAGILGASIALDAARAGHDVVLYESAPAPMSKASRWNEGKIHLGFLYLADSSLRTAEAIVPGGLEFKPLVERLLDTSIDDLVSPTDDTILIHRDSVVPMDEAEQRCRAILAQALAHPHAAGYITDLTSARVERLASSKVADRFDTGLVEGALVVPERSVSTTELADLFTTALWSADIEVRTKTEVRSLRLMEPDGVEVTSDMGVERFDVVVNATWEQRPRLDATAGIVEPEDRSHRYRLAVFVQTGMPVEVGSATVAVGPFGDLKAYSPTRFYLSWYPIGLRATGTGLGPPPTPVPSEAVERRIADETFDRLASFIPEVEHIRRAAEETLVRGGWVYARASGALDEISSTIHRRDRAGVRRVGDLISVDTGKYSIAPSLARRVVASLGK